MNVLITGGAGFIGSNLVDLLLAKGHRVRVIDNFSTGRIEFLEDALKHLNFDLVRGDLLDQSVLDDALTEVDAVVHLAANADVRFGWNHPRRDLEQNVVATQNVLEAMRKRGVTRIVFSSTGSVYGEATEFPITERTGFPIQTSLYGASKAAAEGLIAAYSEAGFCSATVFRFVSILGPRYIDFVSRLKRDPSAITILGNGFQRKSYLHVSDCVRAIEMILADNEKHEIYNLGVPDFCTVNDSLSWICERLNVRPSVSRSNSDRGWIGDNPFILLDVNKISMRNWLPTHGIRDSVESTVDWLMNNQWVFENHES